MRVIVVGGGVIGVTTAYALARSGVRVTLVDRQPAAALETSYANAGQISPGYAAPWAAPGVPLKALKWLLQRHAPLAVRPDGTLFQLRWLAQLLAQCTPQRYAVNKERMLRLAEYSRDCLRELRAETGIAYEGRQLGTLQVFRDPAQLAAADRDVAVLRQHGVPYELLDRDALLRVEPALAHSQAPLVGALRLPGDETGDCHLFTQRLAELARGLGVEFRFGATVERLNVAGGRVESVSVDGEPLQADHVVVALGSYSRSLLAPLGIALPVYPVKGYSLTIPIRDAALAPRSTVMDETYKVAITRFDDRIRVGGMAELAGFDSKLNPRRRETLNKVVSELFGGSGDLAAAEFWTGLRPMTPDGTPLVGASGIGRLWLNTGHGTLGWTMACGSARLLTDLMLQRQPEISPAGLDLSRYGRATRGAAGMPRPAHAG